MSQEYTCPVRESFAVAPHRGVLYRTVGKAINGFTPPYACRPCLERLKLGAAEELDASKKDRAPYVQ